MTDLATPALLPANLQMSSVTMPAQGLGAVIVGGLAVSTVVTLILTPTLMSLVMDAMKLLRREPDYAATPPATPQSTPRRQHEAPA